MNKVYKTVLQRILLNIILGIVLAGFVAVLVTSFVFKNNLALVIIFVVVFIAYIKVVVLDNLITIEVNNENLTVKSKKQTTTYPLSTTSFRAETVNRGSGAEMSLYAIKDDGNEDLIDCEMIGVAQFESLLADIGVSGNKASVTKLDTKKDNE